MATATKTKPDPKPAAEPITFAEIAHNRLRERLESYRELVRRHAAGQTMTVADMEQALELLEQLGLPQYAHERDVEAVARFKMASDKYQAAIDAQPSHAIRATELAAEVEALQGKLKALREELHFANAKANKPTAYGQTLLTMQHEFPHVLADINAAVRLRIEELDSRKRATAGGAV